MHVYLKQTESVASRKNLLENGKNHRAYKLPFSFKSNAAKELNFAPLQSTPPPLLYLVCPKALET